MSTTACASCVTSVFLLHLVRKSEVSVLDMLRFACAPQWVDQSSYALLGGSAIATLGLVVYSF